MQVRLVSQELLFTHNDNISLDSALSHLLVEWGQWIDHDIVQTPQSPSTAAFRSGADCTHTCSQEAPCFPIQVHNMSVMVRQRYLIHEISSSVCPSDSSI